jgi:hypothetical protein
MNPTESSSCCDKARVAAYVIGIGGALFVAAGLTWVVVRETKPEPYNPAARAKERLEALTKARQADAEALASYAWQDQPRGIVRLPIDRAMELTLQEMKNPVAARTNLLGRAEKATAALPKAPEPPSKFE